MSDIKTSVKDLVPARCWYYLLDFNDHDDWKTMEEFYNCKKLHELTLSQFWNFFYVASQVDFSSKR